MTVSSEHAAAAGVLPESAAPSAPVSPFALRGDYITLDALLKATGLVGSGGAAKTLISDGAVQVNGETETRRGRKLRNGDEVRLGDNCVRVTAG